MLFLPRLSLPFLSPPLLSVVTLPLSRASFLDGSVILEAIMVGRDHSPTAPSSEKTLPEVTGAVKEQTFPTAPLNAPEKTGRIFFLSRACSRNFSLFGSDFGSSLSSSSCPKLELGART